MVFSVENEFDESCDGDDSRDPDDPTLSTAQLTLLLSNRDDDEPSDQTEHDVNPTSIYAGADVPENDRLSDADHVDEDEQAAREREIEQGYPVLPVFDLVDGFKR